jgi:nitrous oxide reductase accessory protein NosL
MGKEFIPFAGKGAAENFMRDHKGEKIVALTDITDELVQSMRSKTKMRHGGK